ncbi:hypothetical protein HMPREF1007_03452 [Bacteroides sp. 4_1_36]|uniref:hypothetical protein n=1 Tax=Bacteroides sp. 4_1_36 TaxID=457393 RepID=UPI0001EFFC45|nr:hypothetical protein [Bacteroides sp. 4_1_36]EFV24478.1 hypothetical protein HMPREF1007_03452 [Bacteroides sp. 4_1_36]
MNSPKQSQRFAEIEYCLQRYFDSRLAPVMGNVQQELSKKQIKEYSDYTTSINGILRSAASGMNGMPDDSMQFVKLTGEWNSKTAEDYVEMCRERISSSKGFQKDLGCMAEEWRNTVVAEIGRERYDTLSKELGGDLASAYVDYRVEQMMFNKMVADEMPKSSVEYILRKGASESLLGLTQSLSNSPLEQEIERKGEAAYHPNPVEKGAGKAVAFGADVVTTGGFSSWGSIANLFKTEVVFSGVDFLLDKKRKEKAVTIEDCISKGVFDSKQNVFEDFRKRSKTINPWENDYVQSFNNQLTNKMAIPKEKPFWVAESGKPLWQLASPVEPEKKQKAAYTQVPMVVAPGHEQEYLDNLKREQEVSRKKAQEPAVETSEPHSEKETSEKLAKSDMRKTSTNENGWGTLLGSVGLNGLGDVGKNLGYVVSMLPDMLIGLFTGKTKSLNMKNMLMPVTSILIGLFVKNPLLKMVLIGMGGLNLLNKAGHEAMEKQEGQPLPSAGMEPHFKTYPDEPLNPRIGNPALQGNCLIATIDKVPCSIQLPNSVVAAYEAGALPLNTLSNAVLAKNDQMRQVAQENYRTAENNQSEDKERTVVIK